MVITYEVYKNNVSVGEVVQWICGSGLNTYTMWRATSYLTRGIGGQFEAGAAAEQHLLKVADRITARPAAEPYVWVEPPPGGEHIPF